MSIRQSYKVFIGRSFILFKNTSGKDFDTTEKLVSQDSTVWPDLVEELERNPGRAVLVSGDPEKSWRAFSGMFKMITAAGGLVYDPNGNWLFIHRNGLWDLPKGKLEPGESVEHCAVREVAEECGIEEPVIVRPLSETYHTYVLNNKRILKTTHWFLMKSESVQTLTPQLEEGITEVRWASTNEAMTLAEESYGSVRDIVLEGTA